MVQGRLCRIPSGMYNDIMRIKKTMEKNNQRRIGKNKSVTFCKAAGEYHKKKNSGFFNGGIL